VHSLPAPQELLVPLSPGLVHHAQPCCLITSKQHLWLALCRLVACRQLFTSVPLILAVEEDSMAKHAAGSHAHDCGIAGC